MNAKRVNFVSVKLVKESSVLYKNRIIKSPKDIEEFLSPFLESSDREMLVACCLDTKNQPTCINIVSIGTINSSLVHPREVFKPAILSNSASIILAHNHPSGILEPSKEDINITKRINEVGKIIGITLYDHIIVSNLGYCSLKQKGVL